MKKYLIPLIILVVLAGISCEETIDIEKEKEAIKAVIEEESNAYYARDFDRWAATCLQDETLVRIGATKSMYGYFTGWEESSQAMKEAFESNPEPVKNPEVKTNYKIKVYEDCAWAVFDNESFNDEGESVNKSIHVEFLEKIEGDWKIVYLSIINTSSYDEAEEDEGEAEMGEAEETEEQTEPEETE